ncbi:hypothetical protein CEXT_117711 [Caerostris extrusa]|uniref:Uncharacterized protein n=1 Tax=Caerostris extrusa TaxID=172846 RepID=A0AAV4QZR7_CAEEX|nr:hypothetical protein CEXT_117711 [Caerostris extrusa]
MIRKKPYPPSLVWSYPFHSVQEMEGEGHSSQDQERLGSYHDERALNVKRLLGLQFHNVYPFPSMWPNSCQAEEELSGKDAEERFSSLIPTPHLCVRGREVKD